MSLASSNTTLSPAPLPDKKITVGAKDGYDGKRSGNPRDSSRPSRILITVEDESAFNRVSSLCPVSSDSACRVHWLKPSAIPEEAFLDVDDVFILDSRHHGFRLLCEMAIEDSRIPVVVLVDDVPSFNDVAGVICAFLPRNDLNADLLERTLCEVVRRAAKSRKTDNPRAPLGSQMPAVLHFPPPTPGHVAAPHGPTGVRSIWRWSSRFRSEVSRMAAENDGLLSEMLDHLPIVAAQIGEDGTILDCGGWGLKQIGYPPDWLRGKNLFDHAECPAEALRLALRGTPVTCVRTCVCDGKRRHFECHFSPDSRQNGGVVGFAFDVTDRVEAERARESGEQMMAGILQHIPAIVGRLNADSRIGEVSGSGLAERGLSPTAMEGMKFEDLFPEARQIVRQALAGRPGRFESRLGNGESEWHVEFHLSPDNKNPGGAVFFGQDVTRHRRLEQELLSAVDAERRRLGADLHDEIGQLLTGVTCLSTALAERLRGCNDLAAEDAENIGKIAKEALAQTRGLARSMAPVRLAHRGLPDSLADLRKLVQRMHEVNLHLELSANTAALDNETAIQLFRIVQEAITNAIRHGHATAVKVSLTGLDGNFCLTIADNGRGFDSNRPQKSAGSGLGLIEYRTALIGGRLGVYSGSATGTRIEVCFSTTNTFTNENAS